MAATPSLSQLTASDIAACGVEPHEAETLHKDLRILLANIDKDTCYCGFVNSERAASFQSASLHASCVWQRVARSILRPSNPWRLHELLFASAFQAWDEATRGPPPVWLPTL